jgi:hypothetical protein
MKVAEICSYLTDAYIHYEYYYKIKTKQITIKDYRINKIITV